MDRKIELGRKVDLMGEHKILNIIRASLSADGEQGYGDQELSLAPSLSADGTKVAFHSIALNLVPGDTNDGYDIFVKDLTSGAIVRANVAADGSQVGGRYPGLYSALSADGTRVAFRSDAPDLVPGDDDGADGIFVKNLESGAVTRVRQSSETGSHDLSADGTAVAVQQYGEIYVDDLLTGRLYRASPDPGEFPEIASFSTPALTADGTEVVFGRSLSGADVLHKNLITGEIRQIAADTTNFRFSDDGTRLAFTSSANDLVPGDTDDRIDVFVKDLNTGEIVRITSAPDGSPSDGDYAFVESISADGNRVAFTSNAGNLVPGDTNIANDLFVKDLTTGAIWRINTAADGTQANGESGQASLSADGSVVAFSSNAGNLVPDDTNDAFDVFVVYLDAPAGQSLVGTGAGDVLKGGPEDDVLIGASGNDALIGLAGDDRIHGGRDHDYLNGGAGNDTLYGGPGNDLLLGGPGDDRLDGGPGADILFGGPGRDVLIGGAGPDLFVGVSFGDGDRIEGFDAAEGDWSLSAELYERFQALFELAQPGDMTTIQNEFWFG